jgi:two-component system response regulator (stage 0 sporulation protein F)
MRDKVNILYVDDEPINCMLFVMNFKRKYNIQTATSGTEGLKKLGENPSTAIVISDMKMPGMNGIDFIRQAKNIYPDTVFYILTGFGLTPEISDAINERLIKKYFPKPFDMLEIENSISEVTK